MDTKLLARIGAAVFVGLAIATTTRTRDADPLCETMRL